MIMLVSFSLCLLDNKSSVVTTLRAPFEDNIMIIFINRIIQAFMQIDIDKLIEALQKTGVLSEIQSKRLSTTELPAQVYLRMVIASMATKKSVTNCLSTAMETYTMRNEEKHMTEIKLQAAAEGITIEEYLAAELARRLKRGDETNA